MNLLVYSIKYIVVRGKMFGKIVFLCGIFVILEVVNIGYCLDRGFIDCKGLIVESNM